jgi:hypothetical protein
VGAVVSVCDVATSIQDTILHVTSFEVSLIEVG